MILTEEEAKEKWCPFAQILGTLSKGEQNTIVAHGPHNRGYQTGVGLASCHCIASGCMAWRWWETNVKDENALDNFGNKPGTRLDRRTYGSCGLAGRPE